MKRLFNRMSISHAPKGTPGPGPPLGAAQFQGAESLSAPQGGALNVLSPTGGVDMTVSFFLAIDTMPAAATLQDVINCLGVAAGSGGWRIQLNGTTQSLRWQTKVLGALSTIVDVVIALPVQTWLYCNFTFDNSGGAANIAIFIQEALSGTVLVNQVSGCDFCGPVHTAPLLMGTGLALPFQGRLSKAGVWISAATPTPSVPYLFNGGFGRTGAEVLASLPAQGDPAKLNGYWDLNEPTGAGVWPDATGVHDAAASGTIVSVSAPPTY